MTSAEWKAARAHVPPASSFHIHHSAFSSIGQRNAAGVLLICHSALALRRGPNRPALRPHRSAADERQVIIALSDAGRTMSHEAAAIYDSVLCATACAPGELGAIKQGLEMLRGKLADNA